MNLDQALYVIYRKSKSQSQFVIDHVYTTKSIISLEEIESKSIQIFLEDDSLGPFDSIENLVKYSYTVSDAFKMDGVCLCDSEKYNDALMDCSHILEFNSILLEHGEILKNPEEKKSFFSSFLN